MSELVRGKYFRVTNIEKAVIRDPKTHTLKIAYCDIREGLAIEKKAIDGKYYYVVCFIKPLGHNSNNIVFTPTLEDINFRTVDIVNEHLSPEDLWEVMQEYKNCVEFAKNAIKDSYEG